jgi:hypothetical protein
MASRRKFAVCSISIAAVAILALLLWPAPKQYWAYANVDVSPWTNAFLMQDIETRTLKAVPAIHKFSLTPSFSSGAAALSWRTNRALVGPQSPVGARFNLLALAPTSAQAQRKADEAALALAAFMKANYGATNTQCFDLVFKPTNTWSRVNELGLYIERLFNSFFSRDPASP